jgi:hypothetical protein
MPWKVVETGVLVNDYGSFEDGLNALEGDGWELRFIRPSWHENIKGGRIGADESCVFYKPPSGEGDVW